MDTYEPSVATEQTDGAPGTRGGAGLGGGGAGRSRPREHAVETAPSVFGEVGRRIDAIRHPLVGMLAAESLVVTACCVSDPAADRR